MLFYLKLKTDAFPPRHPILCVTHARLDFGAPCHAGSQSEIRRVEHLSCILEHLLAECPLPSGSGKIPL